MHNSIGIIAATSQPINAAYLDGNAFDTVYKITLCQGEDAEAAVAVFSNENLNAFVCSYETQKLFPGDISGDGNVNNIYTALMLKYYAGILEEF